MAVVVVGGHSRNVGKTSVVAGLIRALPEHNWLAVKITQCGHGLCPRHESACDCAVDDPDTAYVIHEETDRSGKSDTSRFVEAGAVRSLLVNTRQGLLGLAMPSLRREIERAENVIIESNSVMRFIRADLYLAVLDLANPDCKSSAREYLERADALIVGESTAATSSRIGRENLQMEQLWKGVSLKPVAHKPLFHVRPPAYITDEVVSFVRDRLAQLADQRR